MTLIDWIGSGFGCNSSWAEIIGYMASLLVASSFYMKTIIPLRIFAIASNIAFIIYGYACGLVPVLVLHLFLFPLNIIRLKQMQKLIKDVNRASQENVSMEALVPYMTLKRYKKGDTIFSRGEKADLMYYISSGTVRITGLDLTVSDGEIIGEMGVFSPFKERTDSAVAETDLEVYFINEDKMQQLYYQNPQFGFHLIKLLTKRFIINYTKGYRHIEEDE